MENNDLPTFICEIPDRSTEEGDCEQKQAAVPDGYFPRRGDGFEKWLKSQRDEYTKNTVSWNVVDILLDDYRLHADTGTALDEHACSGDACSCEQGGWPNAHRPE